MSGGPLHNADIHSRNGQSSHCQVAWGYKLLKSFHLALGVGLVLSMASCGTKYVQAKVYPVKGKALFDGKPATGATVILHSAGAPLPKDVSPSGKVTSSGVFEISSYGGGDGAPAGEYVAVIDWQPVVDQPDGTSVRGPSPIAATYAQPGSSPLKVTVKESSNELAPFDLQK
jgi:hypothetical protein